jgi:Trypsin-like peptidase domain
MFWNPEQLAMWSELLVGALVVMLTGSPCRAEGADDSLLPYAINVHRTPMQTWGPGYGIYLGKGLFITAAHVVGRAWMTRPKVAIAGQEYPTQVVKEGSFEATDLTLLSIEEELLPMRLRLRRLSLCKEPPRPGTQVVSVIPEATVRSHVIAPEQLSASVRRFGTAIADVAHTGNSGSGVFDAQHRCLLGIMSRKISESRRRKDTGATEMVDIAKYFVPAPEIAAFLPADLWPDQ